MILRAPGRRVETNIILIYDEGMVAAITTAQ